MRRSRSRAPPTARPQALLSDRNTAQLLICLALIVSVGPFVLLYHSSDDGGAGGGIPLPSGAPPPAAVGPRAAAAAAARARRDGYRDWRPRKGAGRMKVYVYPNLDSVEQEGRLLRFLFEGVEASDRLELTDIPDGDGTAWLVDLSKAKCKDLVTDVQESLGRRMDAFRERYFPGGGGRAVRFTSEILWPIYVLDFSDYGFVLDDDQFYNINDLTTDCLRPLSDLLGKRNTHFASRQHVSGREIAYGADDSDADSDADAAPIGALGEAIDYGRLYCANFMSGTVRQIHYGYRTLMNDALLEAAGRVGAAGGSDAAAAASRGDLAALPRPGDVAYFWKVGSDDVRTGVNRDRVRDVLLGIRNTTSLSIYADAFAEDAGGVKTDNVTRALAGEMIRYKIVVVAQKDHYEGHYRLMDALLSGALVLTDPMHPLPIGLKNGDSLTVYRSMADLRKKIFHYLQHEEERRHIGRKGRQVALKYHSPAAWVERIILGNWSSTSGI